MVGERGARRAAVWLVAGLTGLIAAVPPAHAAPSTAWLSATTP